MSDIIYFKHNFENDSVGNYIKSEFDADWKPSNLETAISEGKLQNIEIINCSDFENQSHVSRWILPENCQGPYTSGGKWYTALTDKSDEIQINEVYLTYKIKFKDDFPWDVHVSLPGLTSPIQGTDGEGSEFFLKLKSYHDKFYFRIIDQNHHTNDDPYTKSWNFNFNSGIWYTITIRMVLNSGGVDTSDGIIEGFVNGQLKCTVENLILRYKGTERISTILMQVFALDPTEDSWIEIDDIIAYDYDPTFKEEKNIASGNICMNIDSGFILPPPRLKDPDPPIDIK